MKKINCLLALLFVTGSVNATLLDISVDQDISLASDSPDINQNNLGHQFLWVGDNTGDRDYQGMFGFDMSSLTSSLGAGDSLLINSITFNAYNNFNDGSGLVDIALGNTDLWDANLVTWNTSANDHGSLVSSTNVSSADLNSYVSWDVSTINTSEFLLDDYLTFYLSIPNVGDGNNWHDFESEEWIGTNETYLSIDYSIITADVPEPSLLALIGLGLVGVMFSRKKKTA